MHNPHNIADGIPDAMGQPIGTDAEETVITSGFVAIRTPGENRVCLLCPRLRRTGAE